MASMFARFDVIGSCTDRGTDGIAAWCSTYSIPATARCATSEIGKIAFDEFHGREVRDVLALPGAEIVDDAHALAAADQLLHQVRSDKARAASNQVSRHSGGELSKKRADVNVGLTITVKRRSQPISRILSAFAPRGRVGATIIPLGP